MSLGGLALGGGGQLDGIKEGMKKTNHDVTHYMGLPHPGSPLVFPPPPFLHRANLSRPHPSGKGRGGCSGGWRFQGDAVGFEPTSLKRGEGLTAGLSRVLEGRNGVAKAKVVVVGWVEDE